MYICMCTGCICQALYRVQKDQTLYRVCGQTLYRVIESALYRVYTLYRAHGSNPVQGPLVCQTLYRVHASNPVQGP